MGRPRQDSVADSGKRGQQTPQGKGMSISFFIFRKNTQNWPMPRKKSGSFMFCYAPTYMSVHRQGLMNIQWPSHIFQMIPVGVAKTKNKTAYLPTVPILTKNKAEILPYYFLYVWQISVYGNVINFRNALPLFFSPICPYFLGLRVAVYQSRSCIISLTFLIFILDLVNGVVQ